MPQGHGHRTSFLAKGVPPMTAQRGRGPWARGPARGAGGTGSPSGQLTATVWESSCQRSGAHRKLQSQRAAQPGHCPSSQEQRAPSPGLPATASVFPRPCADISLLPGVRGEGGGLPAVGGEAELFILMEGKAPPGETGEFGCRRSSTQAGSHRSQRDTFLALELRPCPAGKETGK